MPLNALPFQLCTVVTAEHKTIIWFTCRNLHQHENGSP